MTANPVKDLHPCRVVAMCAGPDQLTVLLNAAGRDVAISVALQPRTAKALVHLQALHGHAAGCQAGGADVHVDLLLRSLRATRSWPLCLILRPGPNAAFWLRLSGEPEPIDIDVGVLDAATLLLSGRLPLALLGLCAVTQDDTWDQALATLISDEGSDQ